MENRKAKEFGNAVFFASTYAAISFFIFSCKPMDTTISKAKTGKLSVVATTFPLYDLAKAVAGDKAQVSMLIPPGAESHEFEPKPSDIMAVHNADVFIYTGASMEPWANGIVEKAQNSGIEIVNASVGVALQYGPTGKTTGNPADADPHIWLDLSNAAMMVDNIIIGFSKKDVDNSDYFVTNGMAVKKAMGKLDLKYASELKKCKKNLIIHGGHSTFGYLARRYGLRYEAASGASGEAEPTPATVARLIHLARENKVNNIFQDKLAGSALAETIAKETGAKLIIVDGAHNITAEEFKKGVSFVSIMENNLKHFKKGLECGK
jgi:zinc transport system substrate-binding protein